MIQRLLVANRGEIALRIIRACREARIESVAVFSDADARAPHVGAADRAVHIGPSPADESYLSVRKILDAARTSGADAVHPGYGFLSENPALAGACADAKLTFVGPPADVRGLGVTLWELLTRRRLFADAEDERQLAAMVFDQDVPRLRSVDAMYDRDLEAICARATERRASDRIASPGLLAEYLQLYLDGQPLPIRPPTTGPATGSTNDTSRASSALIAVL